MEILVKDSIIIKNFLPPNCIKNYIDGAKLIISTSKKKKDGIKILMILLRDLNLLPKDIYYLTLSHKKRIWLILSQCLLGLSTLKSFNVIRPDIKKLRCLFFYLIFINFLQKNLIFLPLFTNYLICQKKI
jgi:hypothetical protein